MFPFALSIPHGSPRIPEEVRPSIALSEEEIWDSVDIGTEEIFGTLPARVVLKAAWSRLVVDLNRDPERRYEKGVVAETDYHGRKIHRPGAFPDETEIRRLVRRYHRPFHEKLAEALESPSIRALFDCHSLNGVGPEDAPDAGKRRKDIILSNNGDRRGKEMPSRGRTTCAAETLLLIKGLFEKAGFSVSVNDPYAGGFITTCYGGRSLEKGKLGLQIEINQDLYRFRETHRADPEKTKAVRGRVHDVFREIEKNL